MRYQGTGAIALAVALVLSAPAGAQMPTPTAAAKPDRATAGVLDVPFVPQSEALCGGAAVAMVLRWYGAQGVYAEDFASLVTPDGLGIPAADLVAAVEARGYRALPFRATADLVRESLEHARPVIALLEDRPGRYHFVVLVAWLGDRVVMHDPARGPNRIMTIEALDRAWTPGDHWAMLALPADTHESAFPSATAAPLIPAASGSPCAPLVAGAVAAANDDALARSEQILDDAIARCPDDPAVMVEIAGLRFRQERWADAAASANAALARAPDDAHAWRLLAASRYMSGDQVGALAAWNRVGEPRNDLTRIDGLRRVRYDVAAAMVGIAPGAVVTPAAMARARKRLASLPAAGATRVDYVPLAGGGARIDAAIVERPLIPGSLPDVAATAARAAIDRELRVSATGPTGNGEAWTVRWRWWDERPLIEAKLAAPGAFGVPGVWEIGAISDAETFASADEDVLEHHEGVSLGVSAWLTGSIATSVGVSAERWRGQPGVAGANGSIELRASGAEGIAARVTGTIHAAAGVRTFTTAGAQAAARTTLGEGLELSGHAGVAHASASAPRMLWSGAGTGQSRGALLRAHPLLSHGVVAGEAFGRTLASATIELRRWQMIRGPVRIGAAAFIDGAGTPARERGGTTWNVDGGVGLRVGLLEGRSVVRIDVAHGIADSARALSVAWESHWPAWW